METFLFVVNLIGTVAFAAAGAMTGLRKNMDIFGVCVLGLTTAVGGGIVRDLILGITPPNAFRDPFAAMVAIFVSAVFFLRRFRHFLMQRPALYERMTLWLDSIGLGAFTVIGVQIAYHHTAEPTLFLLVFVGVVTGAGGGIGTAIVRKFTGLGAKAALIDVKEEFCQRTVEKLGLDADHAYCLAGDISDEDSVKAVVAKIVAHYGRIDVLINTAGISGPSARVEDYSFKDVKKVFEVNVFGTFLMMQNVLPVMQAQKSGSIVNFGSVSGLFGYPYEIAYGATKAAVIHMAKSAANENGGNGVRVNAISPGWVNTGMMKSILASYKDVGIENSSDNVTLGPMNRPGEPEEMANAVAFLCSDEASYINGTNFLVDGGMTLG